jgi:hypothetical protein
MYIVFCFTAFLLFERYSRKLDGKALVLRRKPFASQQSCPGLVPALKVGEREAVIVIEVSRVA